MLPSRAVDSDPNPLADPESLYDLHFPDLVNYAVNELHIPRREAEELAANILLGAIRQLATIPDVPAWLRGAMDIAVRGTKC
jgi:DNA-directed RNA polymerase specialized sigma24 family protein